MNIIRFDINKNEWSSPDLSETEDGLISHDHAAELLLSNHYERLEDANCVLYMISDV